MMRDSDFVLIAGQRFRHCSPLGPWLAIVSSLVTLGFTSPSWGQTAVFGQQEMDQSLLIAIARPYGEHKGEKKYDLLILYQIPGQRPCWQETPGTPTLVDPLLLNFDFTDICERSTDSNGYSIRIDGQDFGLDYLLRVVERQGELVLLGTNRRNPAQPEVVIGRTRGLAPGFMKIHLDPGWRFTKRTYGARILSHIYLTGDRAVINAAPNATPPSSPNPMLSYPATPPVPPVTPAPQELIFTAPLHQSLPTPPPVSSPQSQAVPPLPKLSPDAPLRTPIAPSLTASSGRLLPPPPAAPQPTPTTGWGMPPDSASDTDDAGSLLPSTSNAPIPTTRPPVSTSPAWGNRSNRIFNSSLNPAAPRPPVNTVVTSPPVNSQSLRVLALTATPFQQQQVRSLYPEAFNTNYRGQRALQIGRFSSQENAQQALQNLQGVGIQGMIVP